MKEKTFTEAQVRTKNVIAFVIFVVCFSAAYFIWKGLRTQEKDSGVAKTLRKGLTVNESIFGGTFNPNKLVKTYPVSEAEKNVE